MSPQMTGVALIVAFFGGSATTWAVTSSSSSEAASKAEIVAAIKADPALCPPVASAEPTPVTPTAPISQSASLEIPTAEEAQAAFVVEKGSMYPNVKISIGQCDKDTEGPGVACAADIDWGDGSQAHGVVGFAKTPSGWKSTHYY